jgi:hypothetical protein
MTNKKPKYEYDYRYPPNWQQITRNILDTYKVCALCHKNPSKETHHMFYRKSRGSGDLLLADAKVLNHLIPLCLICHKKAHQIKGRNGKNKITYILHPDDNSKNRNTSAFVKQLQVSFKILYGDK